MRRSLSSSPAARPEQGFAAEACLPLRRGFGVVDALRQLAAQWLAITGVRPSEVRFDVVSVYARRGAEPVVQHIRGAF